MRVAGAPSSDAVSKTTVGASSLAKAIDQTRCFRSLYGPFREQARSHGARAGAPSSGCGETVVKVASSTRPTPGP
ncbi:hypothetical protein D5S12_03460 [Pseudomonas syringae]|nr:hypothetical protein D5S12_03460 [Pseudomonas syringae]